MRVLPTGTISFVQLSLNSPSAFVQVMDWIPGKSGDNFNFKQHFEGTLSDSAKQLLKELGRLMAFDIIFNNEDRFSVGEVFFHRSCNLGNFIIQEQGGALKLLVAIDNKFQLPEDVEEYR